MARILVVDDEDLVLMTLNSLIELSGHEPIGTNDGTKATTDSGNDKHTKKV